MKTSKSLDKFAPGIYPNINNEDYHASGGISKSGLSLILKSPLHYFERYLSGAKAPEPTPAMTLGTQIHTAILEPGKETFVAAPTVNRRTKAGKAEYAAFEEANNECTVLKQDDYNKIMGMRSAVLSHPTASSLLTKGEGVAEESIFWEDKETGVLCKCRPDFRRFDGVLIDVKSAKDASPEEFSRSCFNFGYHIQDSFYRAGATAATGEKYFAFIFIVVESTPPHAVAIYTLDDDAKELGSIESFDAIKKYKECHAANHWPGYGQAISTISLPPWAFKKG